jgi:hypothetical protein
MSDPRNTDPRYSDPPLVNTSLPSERGNGAMWGWAAGIAVVILIAFILAAGWNSNPQTAGKLPPATTGSGAATQSAPPPATTAPRPAPSTAPAK